MVGPSPWNLLDVQNRLQITLGKKSKIKVSKMETKTEEDSVIRLKKSLHFSRANWLKPSTWDSKICSIKRVPQSF